MTSKLGNDRGTYFSSFWRKRPARWSRCEAVDKANSQL